MKKLKLLFVTLLMIISMTSVAFAAGSPTRRPIKLVNSDGSKTNKTDDGDDGGLILTIPGKEDSIHSSDEDSDFVKRVKSELLTVNNRNEISVSTDVASSADATTTAGSFNNKVASILDEEESINDDGGLIVKSAPTTEKLVTFVKPIEENIGLGDVNNALTIVLTSEDVLKNQNVINEITNAAKAENRKVFNNIRAVDAEGNVIGAVSSNGDVLDFKTNEVIGRALEDGTVVDLKGKTIASSQNVLEVSHIVEKTICAVDNNGSIYGWYNSEKEAFLDDEGEVIGYLVNNLWCDENGEIIGGTGHYDEYVEYEYVILDSFDLHYWGNNMGKKPPEEVTISVEGIYYGDDIIVHHELADKSIVIEDSEVLPDDSVRIYNIKSFSLFSVSKKQKVVYEIELTDVFQPNSDCYCYKVIGAVILLSILFIIAIIVALVLKRRREDRYNY